MHDLDAVGIESRREGREIGAGGDQQIVALPRLEACAQAAHHIHGEAEPEQGVEHHPGLAEIVVMQGHGLARTEQERLDLVGQQNLAAHRALGAV